MERTTDAGSAGGRGLPLARLALGLVALVALVLLAREAGGAIPRFAAWVEGLGFWGPLVFVAGYAAATVAFVSGAALTLAAGAIFGLGKGFVLSFAGATLGSSLAFLIARYLARSAIERRLAGDRRFAAIDRAIGDQGRKITFLLRLSPAFPFVALNYGLGLTRVRFADYLLASLGMLPGTFLYVYYGKLAGDIAAALGEAPQKSAADYALLGAGLVATIAVTLLVARVARRALAEATGGEVVKEEPDA